MWSELIYLDKDQQYRKTGFPQETLQGLTVTIASGLYEDFAGNTGSTATDRQLFPAFNDLPPEDKESWVSYAEGIPAKLAALNLFLHPFTGFCRTCIITGPEIEMLNRLDNNVYGEKGKSNNKNLSSNKNSIRIHPLQILKMRNWIKINDPERELNLLIPRQLKKAGFEIIRSEEISEIDPVLVKRLARVIHNKYLQELRNSRKMDIAPGLFQAYQKHGKPYTSDFEDLSPEIRYSNLDNAYHIPAKLLSIGYKVKPLEKGYKSFTLKLTEEEIETMARVEHMRWCWEKRLNGWRYGEKRDNDRKIHPGLVEYDDLDEPEKDKDRELVKLIPALLKDIGYEVYPVAPGRIRNLSYAIKPLSTIHRLLSETNNLTSEIASLTVSSPEITGRLIAVRNKIEASIKEVEGSYNYASHIQEVFLPENIFIRECFPESFVLYKPKNIVSGDFYFFSKREHYIFFALADCTGHGIPAALISTIGYGNLDQVVNVKGMTEPTVILEQLYSSIHRFLRRDMPGYGLEDDMDITLCRFNTFDNTLAISGMGNHIFLFKDGEMEEIKPGPFYEYRSNGTGYSFSSRMIEMIPGDTLFLCSDGFADQFGGKNNKRYQKTRLKRYLKEIQSNPLSVQNDLLYSEFERWRMIVDAEQTDDTTVVGIRF